ncbi:uncharacterized protein LOC106130822 isoform X2 [Amyelois transitella]|nr:uncharacterized protein LOC106130822 isoform X2 [Amyelois transitella]XP_060800916.1 uncharacterized protein LOC106130822 isoform X2 [Amyelois transitella]
MKLHNGHGNVSPKKNHLQSHSESEGMEESIIEPIKSKKRKDSVLNKSTSKSPIKMDVSNNISKTKDSESDSSSDDANTSKCIKPKKVVGKRITDRILFEQDDSDNSTDKLNVSSRIKLLQKENSNLQPVINKSSNENVITDDDEIWILKCPSDINIKNLKDSEFNMDKKCKFKMNGETYHGSVEYNVKKMTVTSFEQDQCVIRNVPLNGVVYLKKRIPKQFVQDECLLLQSQNQCIPLPETKCRHPLFGAHYKKAIKVPKKIAEKLKEDQNGDLSPEQHTKVKKKKKKRLRESLEDVETDHDLPQVNGVIESPVKKDKNKKHDDTIETPIKKAKKRKHEEYADSTESPVKKDKRIKQEDTIEIPVERAKKKRHDDSLEVPVKRAKKRKHDDSIEVPVKKAKKKKHNESSEVWDSEKAIEENLFNY